MEKTIAIVGSPAGALLLAGSDGMVLDSITFADIVPSGQETTPGAFADVRRQLSAYFAGELTEFDVVHNERGTPFQRSVWAAVEAIPYGGTISYGELAARVGAPRDRIRAVAAAVGANPLLVVRPCHRVIGADGSLTGYAGGVDRKRSLLVHEGALQPELV
jgi:methylated-DNA-[protein]-cysteine S-methyltransferase